MTLAQGTDYLIVGGGSAGCVLAARLSENQHLRVVLLEAGERHPTSAPPLAWPSLLTGTASWGDHSTTQLVGGRRVELAQGKGLGGSSAINALGFLRGHRGSYDAWTTHGPSWSFDALLPYFRRSESAPSRDPRWRGQRGPMRVGPVAVRAEVSSAFLAAASECGLPLTDDPSAGLAEGLGWADYTVVDGARQSAADAYIRPVLSRENLTVIDRATVHRLVVAPGRVVGVRYARDGEVRDLFADREVVLTAGAVGSPHLLMLSGIGPAEHLKQMGIPVTLDLPGVGSNLLDHPLAVATFATAKALPLQDTRPPGGAMGLVSSGLPATDRAAGPDLQLGLLDLPFSPSNQPGPAHGFSITIAPMAPASRGTVRLSSLDPTARPLIDPRYFTDPHDTDVVLAGLRLAREIAGSPALRPFRPVESIPGPNAEVRDLPSLVAAQSGSYHHLAGTCRLGADDESVVDPELRLHGIEGLRVADSSVMPKLPSANINATVLAIAERAADLMSAPTLR